MKYISTRGQAPALSFGDVLLAGLANDGGLYIPETLPSYTKEEIASWASLSYQELAFKIMWPFVEGEIPADDFKRMIDEAYSSFNHTSIAPMVQTGNNEWVLELFRGPTLAFKDFALQLLGRLMDFVLEKRGEKLVIMGATSGDTGSAAIEGCRHSEHLDIFILHPYQRVSEVQRRQMTTIIDDNVFNIAVKGNFDDCQGMVKTSFADQSFLKGAKLGAVNSINWARIMAQIVYYFSSALSVGAPHRKVSFSVPTGNFGDIFAGYLAKQMGLPIDQLVVATNQNDILHRTIAENDMSRQSLNVTLSPSMDIMVSSNFERLLFDAHGRDGDKINDLMQRFNQGDVTLDDSAWQFVKDNFDSYKVDDEGTCDVIANVFSETQYLLDPHTAIGLEAARKCWKDKSVPMITLATAHPVKFPEAVEKAGCESPSLPEHMKDLFEREESYDVLDNSIADVQQFVADRI
ncbi:threonine synthase [Marinomonas mediterranea]|jgi:L-threonine synthase (EC 4.2.3.1)|uniref:Threonine synthase n=1 Tax=Marinomonas mediterranea (strain ATCC 700492 / JCM 21426 / NBRC 103028 / MMB-1) TaxID=717774 RepID=F2K1Y1_MARM1|nr:threonine synthase [Marinomonas mediterranea]ADZ89975.1 threonine synthase [Marinomonas mediterranea MMB-1]WCN08042.1 threonine synthase [Marinomonas mediterranea]WCN12137.1 threonine synthase [Marinomonas mediterranea]WCN16184.1 threonine synthase [Marinomonas mediterranea MMB-1]